MQAPGSVRHHRQAAPDSASRFERVPIEHVRDYWDRRPCNVQHSPREVGTRAYFDEVEAHIPDLTHVDWQLLEDARNHAEMHTIKPPLYTDAAGDFLLMDRASYCQVGGFNEVFRVAKIHLDSNFCAKAYANGYTIKDIGEPVYHLNHVGSFTVARVLYQDRPHDAPWGHEHWRWQVTYDNPADWGMARAPAEWLDARTTWLDFALDAVPQMVDLKRVLIPGARGDSDLWTAP